MKSKDTVRLFMMKNFVPKIGRCFFLFLFFLNLIYIVLLGFYRKFDTDEFQHAHIAWLMKEGFLIYRDFFEHHGCLLPFIYKILWSIFGWEETFSTLLFLRVFSFLGVLTILFFTYQLGKTLFSPLVGKWGAFFLSGLVFFQDKAIEIRPDVWQNAWWIAGLFFFFRYFLHKNKLKPYFIGLCWGIALFFNMKSMVGPASVVLSLFVLVALKKQSFREVMSFCLCGLGGIFTPALLLSGYFLYEGALGSFWFYQLPYNFILIFYHPDMFEKFATLLKEEQSIFICFVVLGMTSLWLRGFSWQVNVADNKEVSWSFSFTRKDLDYIEDTHLCFFFIFAFTGGSVFLGHYSQYYLIFLPLSSIFGAYFFVRVLNAPKSTMKNITLIFLALLYFSELFTNLNIGRLDGGYRNQREQKRLFEYVMSSSSPNDKMFYTKGPVSAYIFRPHLTYYWLDVGQSVYNMVEGREVFGDDLIKLLQEEKCLFIMVSSKGTSLLPPQTQAFIQENYVPDKYFTSLLVHKHFSNNKR